MTKLVITEKPSVAKDIASVLGRFVSKSGYLENKDYHITWAVGHLVELATPDEYVGAGRWKLTNLPVIPDTFKLNISPKTASQFTVINNLIKKNSYEFVICGTDAGREGELIFRYIYQMTGCTLPVKRLWISSMAGPDIQKGFDTLLDGTAKDNLAQAAYCRAEADWLVGMNGTRAMSVKHGVTLSVGRVQTPTLAMIVNREEQIRNFIPTPYWEVHAVFENPDGHYTGKYINDNNTKIDTESAAKEVSDNVTGKVGIIGSVVNKKTEEAPPKLYNLTDLQRECNKKYALSAAKTLEIVQKLYEEFKFITYPRTDSNHLAAAQIPTFPVILKNLQSIQELAKFIAPLLALPKLPVNKKFVDDAKLTDHHAIIPTEVKPDLKRLNTDQRNVYMLIAKRFTAVFYSPCKAENTTIITKVEKYKFKTTGKVIIKPGWTAIYTAEPKVKDEDTDKEDEEAQTLPAVKKGDCFNVAKAVVLSKKTKKPSQFTEASLLGAMETAGKLIEDEELRTKMKSISLGTPATRASIIETLISREYIVRKGKILIPSEKGIRLIKLIPEAELTQPELTANWEKRLADIEKGLDTRQEFMNDIKKFTAALVSNVKMQNTNQNTNQKTMKRPVVGICPKCGGQVIRGNNAWGCLNIRSGNCDFKIAFKINNIVLSDAHARQLLSPEKKTEIIRGFYDEDKKTYFDGRCTLDAGNPEKILIEIDKSNKMTLQ
ncbi:type IA DNA topoisomerase [Phosphitispora fastidiosa]|uniref:type IA DNA topoisomerase n=1 Tax=Phosphitispora fastidiosa TaxID=2837202 RepID=UPI001E3B849E|nr:type IA DNA topoisomerase [Phosphitispora fastidiosa]MBU7005192.1 DNA topoisomerase-3 [Phosphitispora fastidiosa]